MADWRNRLADDAYNDEYSTADVLRRMLPANPATSGMRSLADGLPANTENGLSILNMIKAGLGSAANWLDQRPELGPDTLAPLGLAAIGSPLGLMRGAAAAERSPAFRLTPIDRHSYAPHTVKVNRDGESLGKFTYTLRSAAAPDDTAFIQMIALKQASGEPLTLGDLRQLREAFRELQPSVTRFEGQRYSGARARNNPDAGPSSPRLTQAVVLPADSSRASLPGILVNGLEQSAKPERPVHAAIRVGGQTLSGPTHFDALRASVPRAVERDLWGDDLLKAFEATHGTGSWADLFGRADADGFMTNRGNYVTRKQAAELARAADNFRPSLIAGKELDAVEYGKHLGYGQRGLVNESGADAFGLRELPPPTGRTLPRHVYDAMDPTLSWTKS